MWLSVASKGFHGDLKVPWKCLGWQGTHTLPSVTAQVSNSTDATKKREWAGSA